MAATDMADQLRTHAVFQNVLLQLDKAIVTAKGTHNNPRAFTSLAFLAEEVSGMLRQLGSKEVTSRDVYGCTILQQVRYASLEVLELCDQYENPKFENRFVFSEVYNKQLNKAEYRLHGLSNALSSIIADFDSSKLRLQPLYRYTVDFKKVNYAATNSVTTRSLPTSLGEDGCCDMDTVAASALWGHWHAVEEALIQNTSLATQETPFPLLHLAVLWQNLHAIATLLSHSCNVNAAAPTSSMMFAGTAPLHLAMAVGNPQVVRLLLASGADSHLLDRNGQAPAMVPSNHFCQSALENVAAIQRCSAELCSAAYDGSFAKLFALTSKFELPMNVRYKPSSRYFLIHQTAYSGDMDSYLLAIEAGASPLLRTRDFVLPSGVAQSHGRMDLAVRMLQIEEAERKATADPIQPLTVRLTSDLSLPKSPVSNNPSATFSHSPSGSTTPTNLSPARSPSYLSPPESPSVSPTRQPSPLRDAISYVGHKVTDRVRRRLSDMSPKSSKSGKSIEPSPFRAPTK